MSNLFDLIKDNKIESYNCVEKKCIHWRVRSIGFCNSEHLSKCPVAIRIRNEVNGVFPIKCKLNLTRDKK